MKEVQVYRIYDNYKQEWHYSFGYVEEDSKAKMTQICIQLNALERNLRYMQAKDYK